MRKDTESQISCSAFGQGASETRVKSPTVTKEMRTEPPVPEQKPAPVKRGDLPEEITGLLEVPQSSSAESMKENADKSKRESKKNMSEQQEIDKQFQDFDMKIKNKSPGTMKMDKSAQREQNSVKKMDDSKPGKETTTSQFTTVNGKAKKEPELRAV